MGGRGQGSEWPQGSALLAGGPMDQSRSIFHTHASGWPRIPGACCIQHWAPQSPGPTHSSDHFSPVRRLKGDGFCGCPDVAIPEKGASGPELLLWVNPSLSPKSPFSGPGPWPSAEWTCDQPLGGCPQREGQGEERAGHRSGPAGGSSLLPSLMCVRCPPSSVALVSTGYGTQGDAARPWFKCSEQRRSDSRAVSPGTAVPGCQWAWCPCECIHPSPASWPPPQGPAERAGGRMLTWGFLCRGSGPFLKTPLPSWCHPVHTLTCLQKPRRWGWAHGQGLENPDERAQESWQLREKTLPRRGASRDTAAVPPFLVPTPAPQKREPPGGEEGRQTDPPELLREDSHGDSRQDPGCPPAPQAKWFGSLTRTRGPHKPDASGDPDASLQRVSSCRCEHGARMPRA